MKDKIPIIKIINKEKEVQINEKKISKYLKLLVNPKKLILKLINKIIVKNKNYDELSYDYKKLFEKYGKNAVIDSRYPKEEFDYVTKKQKEILFPILFNLVEKKINNILDFGCCVGRFTESLSKLFNCKVLGVDTSKHLINMCEKKELVNFLHIDENCNQLNSTFDLIFINQVINGIPDNKVYQLAEILTNKLNNGGQLFLVEATGKKNIKGIWRVRTIDKIVNFFPKIELKYISKYIDIDSEVSIFFGKKINN